VDFDRRRTLAELVSDPWPVPGPESSGVHRELDHLRHVPLRELHCEDLRLLITHHVGLTFAVPLALEIVEDNPLMQAFVFPGDVLTSLLRVDPTFWEDHPALRARMSAVLDSLRELPHGTESVVITAAEAFPG
jgi:hypothetical protein